MRSRVLTTSVGGGALALLAGAALAYGATPGPGVIAPTMHDPTPLSLRQSQPVFTWTNGPNGEYVGHISIQSTPGPDGEFVTSVPPGSASLAHGATRERSPFLLEGRYYWTAVWFDPSGSTAGAGIETAERTFVVPPRFTALTIGQPRIVEGASVTIGGSSAAATVELRYRLSGNRASYRAVCTLFNGKRVVARGAQTTSQMRPLPAIDGGCRVVLRRTLLGKRLRLQVVAKVKGQTRTATRAVVIR